MLGRETAHVTPDGIGSKLVIKIPPLVHLFVACLIGGLAAIWINKGDEALKGVLGILAAALATYSAFYGRKAIISARERERRFETVKFSRIFSDNPLATARTALSTRFRQILNQQEKGNDETKHNAAVKVLSDEMLAAMEKRDSKGKETDDLVDEAIAVLDFFEDLAVGIEDGVFDNVTAYKLLRGPLVSFWRLHQEVAKRYRRVNGQPKLYAKTELLYDIWEKTAAE